jgi:ferritin
MLSESVLTALQAQMAHEYGNFHKYKSFAGIADSLGLIGTTSWFNKQAMEEYGHFDKLFTFISDMGHIPKMPSLPEIEPAVMTMADLFTQTVMLEKGTEISLRLCAAVCKEMSDDASYDLLLWFVREQVEEVKTVEDILKRVIMSSYNLLLIDNELGAR